MVAGPLALSWYARPLPETRETRADSRYFAARGPGGEHMVDQRGGRRCLGTPATRVPNGVSAEASVTGEFSNHSPNSPCSTAKATRPYAPAGGVPANAVCERCQPSMSPRIYASGGVLVPSEHHIGMFHEWLDGMLTDRNSRRARIIAIGHRKPTRPGKPARRARPGPELRRAVDHDVPERRHRAAQGPGLPGARGGHRAAKPVRPQASGIATGRTRSCCPTWPPAPSANSATPTPPRRRGLTPVPGPQPVPGIPVLTEVLTALGRRPRPRKASSGYWPG
jgi:hypothetical protein